MIIAHWPLFLLLLAACFAAAPVRGAEGDDEVIKKMTGKMVMEILEEEGFKKPQLFPPNKEGDPEIVSLKTEGRSVLLFVPSSGVSVQGHFATKDLPVDLKKVNDWNRNSYFTKACVLSDGSACLSSDMAVEGGVTKVAIAKQITFFLGEVGKFYRKLEEK
jgi:hypothetical protein